MVNLLRGSTQPPFKRISEEENLAMGENEACVSLRAYLLPSPSGEGRRVGRGPKGGKRCVCLKKGLIES